MLGLFRVIENDKTLVIELFSLFETPDGVALRFRHFTPALVPWEQSGLTTMKLVEFGTKSAVFENSAGRPAETRRLYPPGSRYLRLEIRNHARRRQLPQHRNHLPPAEINRAALHDAFNAGFSSGHGFIRAANA